MSGPRSRTKFLVGFVCVVSVFAWREASVLGLTTGASQLDSQIQMARAEGLPNAPADLNLSPVPEDENAFPLVMSAYLQIASVPGRPVSVLDDWQSKYAEHVPSQAAAASALRGLQKVLDAADLASRLPQFDPHWQWNKGPFMEPIGLYEIVVLARCFTAKSRMACLTKQPDAGIRALLAAACLDGLLAGIPGLDAERHRLTIEWAVFRAASDLLREYPRSSVLNGLKDVLAAMKQPPDLKLAMRGEFLLLRISMPLMGEWQERYQSPSTDTPCPEEWQWMRVPGISTANQANAIRLFRESYAALPEGSSCSPPIVAAVRRADARVAGVSGIAYMAADLLSSHLDMELDSWARCLAERRVLAAAIEVFKARAASGRLPHVWSKAGPDGRNPFTDAPLTYRRTESGFDLIAKDDDQIGYTGNRLKQGDSSRRPDISFEYRSSRDPDLG